MIKTFVIEVVKVSTPVTAVTVIVTVVTVIVTAVTVIVTAVTVIVTVVTVIVTVVTVIVTEVVVVDDKGLFVCYCYDNRLLLMMMNVQGMIMDVAVMTTMMTMVTKIAMNAPLFICLFV